MICSVQGEQTAERAMISIIQYLGPLLASEVELLRGVRKEIVSIKAELERIHTFLKDAESREETGDEGVKPWVKQIQDIMTTIREIKEGAYRYGFSTSTLSEHSSSSKDNMWCDPRLASLFIGDDKVVGIESPKYELISRLVDQNQSQRTVISVVGMGGISKTTLAKKVYDSQEVVAHFNCKAWITVSQSYKLEELLKTMINELSGIYVLPNEGIESLIVKLSGYLLEKSYHDLPHHLKSCFLYFGIMPEDYSIKAGRLIQLWIAEGCVEEQNGKTLEEVAEEYLTELIHRRLVLVSITKFDGRVGRCQVHDVVREIILSMSKEFSLCQILEKENSSFNVTTHRLSMHMRYCNMDKVMKCISKSPVRSVFLFQEGGLPKKPLLGTLAANFKLLTVLDLECAHLDQLHEVGNLFVLRYLSIRSTQVKIIPKSIDMIVGVKIHGGIGGLEELQRLWSDLTKNDPLKALQVLPSLVHLMFCDAYDGEQLYFEVGRFQKLKELTLIGLKGLNSVMIEEGALPLLKKLMIEPSPRLKEVPSSIHHLKNLKTLYFVGMAEELIDRIEPKPHQGKDYWIVEHIPEVMLCSRIKKQGRIDFDSLQEYFNWKVEKEYQS
ncbi:hypothetical protein ACSBR1_030875 [Camellia fascicularis]